MNIEELIQNLNFSNIAWQILTPMIFSITDVISGFIQAVINKNVDSSKMRVGLFHKLLLILVVILSFVTHFTFNLPIISKMVCSYIIIMESFSILENLKKAGLNLGKITDILNIKGKEENK